MTKYYKIPQGDILSATGDFTSLYSDASYLYVSSDEVLNVPFMALDALPIEVADHLIEALSTAKAQVSSSISSRIATRSDFLSDALGSFHTYTSSALVDVFAILLSGTTSYIACTTQNKVTTHRLHTIEQARVILSDYLSHRAELKHYFDLEGTLDSLDSLASVLDFRI